jgi:hypothetical protein
MYSDPLLKEITTPNKLQDPQAIRQYRMRTMRRRLKRMEDVDDPEKKKKKVDTVDMDLISRRKQGLGY